MPGRLGTIPSMGRIWADIAFENWLSEFQPCQTLGHLPTYCIWKLIVQISALYEVQPSTLPDVGAYLGLLESTRASVWDVTIKTM